MAYQLIRSNDESCAHTSDLKVDVMTQEAASNIGHHGMEGAPRTFFEPEVSKQSEAGSVTPSKGSHVADSLAEGVVKSISRGLMGSNSQGRLFVEVTESLSDLAIQNSSCTPSQQPSRIRRNSSPMGCAICLSPIPLDPDGVLRPEEAHENSRPRGRFQTPCCKQLFHRSCMERFKNPTPNLSINEVAPCLNCPLCRSEQKTGLTPTRPPTGFVSAQALHTAIQQRASAARLAVQRSLVARRGLQPLQETSPVRIQDTASPFQEVLSHRVRGA